MSYSVSIKFSSEREHMRTFLLNNIGILEKLKDTENTFFQIEPTLGENLGYATKKDFLLGFQGSESPGYIWNLCAWMGVKSTHRDNNEMYFFYDDEKMIVTHN